MNKEIPGDIRRLIFFFLLFTHATWNVNYITTNCWNDMIPRIMVIWASVACGFYLFKSVLYSQEIAKIVQCVVNT